MAGVVLKLADEKAWLGLEQSANKVLLLLLTEGELESNGAGGSDRGRGRKGVLGRRAAWPSFFRGGFSSAEIVR
jgi:hypothetical protein